MVDYRIFDRDKFTVVGTPTITDDGIASNFANRGAIRTIPAKFGNKHWKIKLKLYYDGSDFTGNRGIISSSYSSDFVPIMITFNSSKYLTLYLSSNGTSSDIAKDKNSDRAFQQAGWYFFEIGFTGTQYYVDYSVDGENYSRTITVNSSLLVNNNDDRALSLGNHMFNTTVDRPFPGLFDLKQFSITADGVEVFSGSHNANVVERLQYLKDSKEIIRQSIEDKGVVVPEETPFREYADKISEIKTGSGSAYQKMFSLLNVGNTTNITDDGILTCVSTQNSNNDKVCIAYKASLIYYGFTAECKFNMSLINSSPNIIIGGNANNGFVIGIDSPNSDCIGIWYRDNRNYTYTPETEHGITPIQTNKDYWLRFTYKMNTYGSNYTYTIEMKENKDDEYHLEWTSPRNNQLYANSVTQVYFGGGYYANTIFSFDGTVDLKECNVIPHPGTGVVVNVGG